VKKKNKNPLLTWILVLALAASIPLIYFIYKKHLQNSTEEPAKAAFYTAFGIPIPTGYTIHGIDVSKHQQYIHWPAVATMEIKNTKINFAFIKATEGLNDTDKYFSFNWKQLQEQKITRGAYLFFLATKSGKLQAENYIKRVQLTKGDLPPVVDVEELYGVPAATMRKRVKECLDVLEKHYKVKPIVYSYVDFYEQNLGNSFNDYPLWIAHYFEKEKPRISRDWQFWQHNEKGRVNGITTKVDFNVFKGDTTAFKNLLVK
jgi:lysozyme